MFHPLPAGRSRASSSEPCALTRPSIATVLGVLTLVAAQSAFAQESKRPAPQETIPVLEPIRARTPAMQDRARHAPAETTPPPEVRHTAAIADRSRVEYDAPGDGSVWARGADYKVGFSAQGTAYAPFLGSNALGDTILAGTMRSYYIYYRDPIVLGGCPSASTFNATQAVQAIWIP